MPLLPAYPEPISAEQYIGLPAAYGGTGAAGFLPLAYGGPDPYAPQPDPDAILYLRSAVERGEDPEVLRLRTVEEKEA